MRIVPKARTVAREQSLAHAINAYRGERTQLLRNRAVTGDHVAEQRLALVQDFIARLSEPSPRRRAPDAKQRG
jgi:hypothetical protein